MLGHQKCPSKFKKAEIISSMFSDHKGIRSEINYKEKKKKQEKTAENTNMWRLSVSCSVFPTLCDPVDCSPPGSSVHGILQARILEWVAMPYSRGSAQSRDQTHIFYISLHWCSLPSEPAGKPCGG